MKKAKLQSLDIHDYKPIRGRRNLVLAAFAASALLALGVLVVDVMWYHMLSGIIDNSYATQAQTERLAAHEELMGTLSLLQAGALLLALLVFAVWFSRSCYNCYTLSVKDIDYTPNTAIAFMLVPLVNLNKPYKCLAQLHNGCKSPYVWRMSKMPLCISATLIVGLVFVMLMAVSLYMQLREQSTFSEYLMHSRLYICQDVLALLWFSLMMRVVWKVSKIQMKRAEELTKRAYENVK